jgi:hypothetical protein
MNRLEERTKPSGSSATFLVLAWLWVGVPLVWGIVVTIQNALKLFT